MKPRFGIDIDGVLGEFNNGFWRWHNKNFGTNIVPAKDCVTYDYSTVLERKGFNIEIPILIKRTHEFLETVDHFEYIDLVPGAKDAVKKLSEYFDIYIITARHKAVHNKTVEWINRHFSGYIKDIISIHNIPTKKGMPHKHKGEVVEELNIKFMVEDAIIHAKDTLRHGTVTFLLEQPWNKYEKYKHPKLIRVKNWQEILRRVRDI